MARAATSDELTLYRTPGKRSILHATIRKPNAVYTARINQTFSTFDQVLTIVYDGGSGTLANVLPDMELWVGSTAGSNDKGICRLRDKDATHFYVSETSEIQFADNDYITIVDAFGVWARPVRIVSSNPVMDETAYSDQHTNWDPMPNMGPHQVAELTGSTVNVSFHGGGSFCPGSSISAYSWSCATASASSGTTSADVTFQFNVCGWHVVYLTVTAANGKTFFGVRYVYVWNAAHPPLDAVISNPGRCDVDSGGWEIELTCFNGVTLTDVYERAMVILFSDDYYGNTKQAIGPVAGSENIWFIGWISGESNHLSSEQGSVTFTANGAAYWMEKMPSWADGVEWQSTASWTSVPNLTVDLGVYHHLRWRSTLTRVMDVTLTGDTRNLQEVSSSAQNLWSQLQDMTWATIYARPGVNALNQLSIQIHPSLIPTASRTYPTVMTITKADYADELDFDRDTIPAVGMVDMSGVKVTGPGVGTGLFALAPGHSYPHYGEPDIQSYLAVESQSQLITLAGLYRSHENNHFKSIPIVFDAPIRLIDCFPNQRCTISISSSDNVRGWAYSGGLIPVSVQLVHDAETGYAHTEVVFEAQTSESQSRVGDTPGSGDTSNPPTPSLPPIVIPPIVIPGGPPTSTGSKIVIGHDDNAGFFYTENFDSASPNWNLMNGNLNVAPYGSRYYYKIANRMVVTSAGIYAAFAAFSTGAHDDEGQFIAFTPGVGQLWTILKDYTTLHTEFPEANGIGIGGLVKNILVPDQVGVICGNLLHAGFFLGSAGVFTKKSDFSDVPFNFDGNMSYGFGKWRYTGLYPNPSKSAWLFSSDGTGHTLTSLPSDVVDPYRQRALGTGPSVYMIRSGIQVGSYRFDNNFVGSPTFVNMGGDVQSWAGSDCDPTGLLLMALWGGKGKSFDGGATWSALGSLPLGVNGFTYEGIQDDTSASSSMWLAYGSIIRETKDGGSTWANKEGDITSIIPIPSIGMMQVVG